MTRRRSEAREMKEMMQYNDEEKQIYLKKSVSDFMNKCHRVIERLWDLRRNIE